MLRYRGPTSATGPVAEHGDRVVRGAGKAPPGPSEKGRNRGMAEQDRRPLLVIAAGGPAGGFGAVIPPWFGGKSNAVTMAIGACFDCEA